MSEFRDGFWSGFVIGAMVCFVILFIIANIPTDDKPRYKYVNIDNMTCVEINGEFVSCNWSDK